MYNQEVVERLYQYKKHMITAAMQRMNITEERTIVQRDIEYNMDYLIAAINADSLLLFSNYMEWLSVVLQSRNIKPTALKNTLTILQDIIQDYLPEEHHAIIKTYLQAANDKVSLLKALPPRHIAADNHLANHYLQAARTGDRQKASRLILDAVQTGTSIEDILMNTFQPVLREVGRLWQTNEITIGQEHLITATTQSIMSQLYSHIFTTQKNKPVLVAACVSDELHEVGLRMLADFFEMSGWHTIYLGANVPAQSIIGAIEEHQANIVALSTTIYIHIKDINDTIQAIRRHIKKPIPILVGGYPFNVDPELWKRIGADACARDAKSALALANELMKAG